MESFLGEAVKPIFGKKYMEIVPVTLIWDILFKLLLRIFTVYTNQNNE